MIVSRLNGMRAPKRCVKRIKLFLRLYKVCGMFANEITRNRLKYCSWPYYGIGTFWLSIYVSQACYLLYCYATSDSIEMSLTVEFLKHLIGYTSLGFNTIVAYSSQNHFIRFFDRLESYDDEVARMKNARQDHFWILWIAVLSTGFISISLLLVATTAATTNVTFLLILPDVLTMVMHIYGTSQILLMLYLMMVRFRHLNRRIVPNVSWDERRRIPSAINVLDVKTLYSMLYDAQQAFSVIYSNLILIWFASLMIHVVANIRAFREKGSLIACTLVFPSILQVLLLCAICHYTAEEANKVPCVLSEDMCTLVNSEHTTIKIGAFAHFLHNRISFEAAGYFTIDLPLLQSIVAAVTTYFIILT